MSDFVPKCVDLMWNDPFAHARLNPACSCTHTLVARSHDQSALGCRSRSSPQHTTDFTSITSCLLLSLEYILVRTLCYP